MNKMKSFGQSVRYHRKKKQISQKALAAKVGVSPGDISHLERGRFSQSGIMTLGKALTLIQELPISNDERAGLRQLAIEWNEDKTPIAKFPETGKALSEIIGHAISANDVSMNLQVSTALVSQWRTGKQAPKKENARKLVQYFTRCGVTPAKVSLYKGLTLQNN